MMREPRGLMWITTFGLGRMRPAPGTWGSLPPAVIGSIWVFAGCGPVRDGTWCSTGLAVWLSVMILFAIVFSWACVAMGDEAEARYGKDPGRVVADETAGMGLTLALMPWTLVDAVSEKWAEHCCFARGAWPALAAVWVAFVLFRVMDIVKPWPARGIQRVPGGWGVLLDDLIAGVYAAAAMWGLGYLLK